MKWYVLVLFLVVGFVCSVSAQQVDPKLVGSWESTDEPCRPCTLTIDANGKITFTQAGSPVELAYSQVTPTPGVDLMFPRWGKAHLKLSGGNTLVGFYTNPTRFESYELIAFHKK
jgi:hypothetical protein